MAIIITVLGVWIASAVIRSRRNTRTVRRFEAIEAEQRRADRERREETRIRLEIEHEQAKQARKIAEHEAWLKKHDEEIRTLSFKYNQLTGDIDALKEQLGNLYALLDIAENNYSEAIAGGKRQEQYLKQIVTRTNQIRTAEKKLEKAQFDRQTVRAKMEEVA